MSKCVKCGNEILTGDIHWEMGLCNNCYNELYKDHKTHISLDKMWLNLAQSFRDENEKLQEKISDIEAKLAEKDKAIENWQTIYESVVQTCHNDKEEIKRLNKRLETQENTITNLVEDNRASQEWYKKQLEEKEKERHEEWKTGKEWKWEWQKVNQELEKADQDKISFAVEKLEQVKETAECVLDNALKNSSLNQSYYDRLLDEIDNQIKQLRKGK